MYRYIYSLDTVRERIIKLKDKAVETIQTEAQRNLKRRN